jgi:hypothetical protein
MLLTDSNGIFVALFPPIVTHRLVSAFHFNFK